MLNIEQEVAAYERNVLSSSPVTLAEEISAQLARAGIVIKTENGERPATLEDLTRALEQLGLEVVPAGTVNWDENYPERPLHDERIRQLNRQLHFLQVKKKLIVPDT